MNGVDKDIEIKQLQKEVAKLRLESNMRKSLSNQLSVQKKLADDAKAEALAKTKELEIISSQLSRYLSPQIHQQIFTGKQSSGIKSYRKKLTIFFSDIVNFTEISDQLESEELTSLLNFYLNEMSQIALKYGGTIDKYIGDAIMIFFGDPESLGVSQDAKNCVDMAIDMQRRMKDLKGYWGKNFSLKKDLQIRIGINSGFSTVGNFGSEDRLDYTVVGGAVNMASRLESISKPETINISEDTFMLVRPFFEFGRVKEAQVKGFLRKVRYYELNQGVNLEPSTIKLSGFGFDLTVNQKLLTENDLEKLKSSIMNLGALSK